MTKLLITSQLRHGYARRGKIHPLHRVWRAMLQRCENPNDKRFASYGGRGVKVCDRWHDFELFLEDVGPRPPGVGKGGRSLYSIDRVDNDGDYEPGNVKWSTAVEQGVRTTRSRVIEHGGESLTLAQWSRRLGVHHTTLLQRIRKGWPVERVLT